MDLNNTSQDKNQSNVNTELEDLMCKLHEITNRVIEIQLIEIRKEIRRLSLTNKLTPIINERYEVLENKAKNKIRILKDIEKDIDILHVLMGIDV